MKGDTRAALLSAFRQEAEERLERAVRAMDESAHTTSLLDSLHQEFDSLYGASRAVNCAVLEALYRAMAEHARRLRREGTAHPDRSLTLLREGVRLARENTGVESCSDCTAHEEIDEYVARLKQYRIESA